MRTIMINKKDEIIMRLAHYFITEQNYAPIIVNGVKDEIWLQNQEGPYKIIRINANYIHNDEQMNFDLVKLNNVMHQVKRKTISFTMNALNILLDVNDNIKAVDTKNINSIVIKNLNDIKEPDLIKPFPDIKNKLMLDMNGLDLIVNVTNDINHKTEEDNRLYEKTFRSKKIVFTNALIFINVLIFMITFVLSKTNLSTYDLIKYGASFSPLVKSGEVWRLITAAFLHAGIIHLLVNMYSLYIIGTQVETYIGKYKFLGIYLVSAISGTLMSCIFNPNVVSVGASGAIFGLLGSLLYFGYHYRLYLGSVLRNQIIPIIIINLVLGFMVPSVDNAAHIGGLLGGYLATMALGVNGKSSKNEMVNGIITTIIYLIFLAYIVFFR